MRAIRTAGVLSAFLLVASPAVQAQHGGVPGPSVVDEGASMADKLGNQAAMASHFVDEQGQPVEFSQFFASGRPVLLNLGYFGCPGLCSAVLNYFTEDLQDAGILPGRDFEMVTLSIDPNEGPALASEKKASYLEKLGHPEVADNWHFLTGEETQIRRLADSVGWRYRHLLENGQYDHPPVLVFLSSLGYTTRYLNALTMGPTTLRRAVVEASEGRVGSFLDRIFLSCLTFDPNTGGYTLTIMTVMRIGGLLTVLALGTLIYSLWRRERKRIALATT